MSRWIEKQDRLQQILGLLKSDQHWTTKALSHYFDVSLRTITRDLDLLKEQGIPIESSRGKGGGIALAGRYGLGRFNLSDSEVLNLIMSLTVTEQLNLPFMAEHLGSLRHKFSLFLNERQRAQVNKLRQRILVGRPASEEIMASFTAIKAPHIDDVNMAFFEQRLLSMAYQTNQLTQRIIEPQLLVLNWPVWYLVGWDHLRGAPRMFRVDRIVKATALKDSFTLRPERHLTEGFGHLFQAL